MGCSTAAIIREEKVLLQIKCVFNKTSSATLTVHLHLHCNSFTFVATDTEAHESLTELNRHVSLKPFINLYSHYRSTSDGSKATGSFSRYSLRRRVAGEKFKVFDLWYCCTGQTWSVKVTVTHLEKVCNATSSTSDDPVTKFMRTTWLHVGTQPVRALCWCQGQPGC